MFHRENEDPKRKLLLSNGIQVASNLLVHPEHVDPGLLEHSLHLFVAANLPLVFGILQIVGLDVLPELLDDLRARKLDGGDVNYTPSFV